MGVPKRCRGSVRLFAKLGKPVAPHRPPLLQRPRRAARARSSLTIRKRAYRKLRKAKRLRVQVRATANGAKTARIVRHSPLRLRIALI